jgi:hypothetical protein
LTELYSITLYIITTVKRAIWLVNNRAGSGYPARGIKMPSRDFRGILKMSLFHCSYFIKQLPNDFPSRIAWSMHLECCSIFGKRKNTLACGSSIFTLSESLAASLVHGSRNPARKTIRNSFNDALYIYVIIAIGCLVDCLINRLCNDEPSGE